MHAVRNLLLNLVRRDLTVRYRSTVLGFFWSFLKPLAMTAIFYVVFTGILKIELKESRVPFVLHLLTGILAWTFFAGATSEAMNVILGNANLIKKVRLPLIVFPLATVCSHLIHFGLALLVLIGLMIAGDLPPTPAILLVLPIAALHFLLTLAVSLTLSSLNVFYRDISSVWEVLTTAWFYATPIIYPVYMAMDKLETWGAPGLRALYLANPMTPIVLAYRRVLLYAPLERETVVLELPDSTLFLSLAGCLLVTVGLLAVGWLLFRRYSRLFADEL